MMQSFMTEQETAKVLDLEIGGQPGETSTLLMGTVFYGKEFKKLDNNAYALAKDYLIIQQQLSKETGVSQAPDVYVKNPEVMGQQLDFILENYDGPFAIDSSEAETRSAALKYLGETGVLDRVIYNSLNIGSTQDEFDTLADNPPAVILVLAFNPRDMSVDGRMQILDDGAGMLFADDKGLLEIAQQTGTKGIIVDTGATPFGSQSCETMRSLAVFKSRYGLPVGCSIHNTLESWSWMKDHRKQDEISYECANAASNCLVPMLGGDFVVYGPIKSAPLIFPSVAFTDKLVAEGAHDYFGVNPCDSHPYNLLK